MDVERITVDPGRMRGAPCVRGTRMAVVAVLGQLAAVRDVDQVVADHPYLEVADVLAALEFAAAVVGAGELPPGEPA